ncbi:MAG TPA: enoyl-CoA hydratase/isomerase family protein, partial [Acidocella sp.]|nr:enoyl-CoA hydratase/isomerase family protein [Acidocella sp.]
MKKDDVRPPPEEIILYEKDPKTKIATITLNRPDALNSPTIAARLRYSQLIHRANVDDDVKVLVIRGVGNNLGGGADLAEQADMIGDDPSFTPMPEFDIGADEDVKYPPKGSYRYLAQVTQLYANSNFGCRSLQDFKKIS